MKKIDAVKVNISALFQQKLRSCFFSNMSRKVDPPVSYLKQTTNVFSTTAVCGPAFFPFLYPNEKVHTILQ